jgi:hypothetical protein
MKIWENYYWYKMIVFSKYQDPKISSLIFATSDVIIKTHFMTKFDKYIESGKNCWWYFWIIILWKNYYWYVMIIFPKYQDPKISSLIFATFDVIIKIQYMKKFDKHIESGKNCWWYIWIIILWENYYWYVMIIFPKYQDPKISQSFSAQFDVIIKIQYMKKFDQYIELSRNWRWYFWMMIFWEYYYWYVMIIFLKYHYPKISP